MSGISAIASAFRGGVRPRYARGYLVPLDSHSKDGKGADKILDGETRSFQYFPESINDTKAANYQTKVIPGLSHPLYQWTSSGGREVSFETVFTRDRALTTREKAAISSTPQSRLELNDDGVKKARKDAEKASVGLNTLGSNDDVRNVDIPSAVAWLRSYMYPEYSQDGTGYQSTVPHRPRPPRKMILGLPGLRLNWGVPTLPPSEMYVIMIGCDVNYTGFFSDGTPRIARVSLTFAEIIQVQGGVHVQDAHGRRSFGIEGYRLEQKGLGSGR